MSAGATVSLDDLDWWTRPVAERDAFFAALRDRDELAFFPEVGLDGSPRGKGFWAVTRFADVIEVSRRPDDFLSGEGINIFDESPDLRAFFGSFISMDNPQHARLRKIVSRGFTARRLDALRDTIEHTARELLADLAGRGSCDFVTDFAALLPLRIVNDMMGIPRSKERFVFEATNIVMAASDPEYVPDQTPRAVATALARTGTELAAMLREFAEDRIRAPKDDLITTLVAAQEEENLTPQELASFFILLIGAGNETTRNAIAHAMVAFSAHPDQRDVWLADPAAVSATAVEEIIRWASPVLHMRRTVARDGVRLGEQEFRAGDKVVLWYRSANFDDRAFAAPEQFDVRRTPNPHVAFGAPGPHFCLGAHLARLEIAVTMPILFEVLPDIHATGEPEFLRSNFLHGIKHLPAAFTPVPA